ncbi:rhodanese-like domain-containing protein [bacterium]|nr:rhodanese-like domain-containing protein [bacterium]
MKKIWSDLSLNYRLASIALLLGFIGLFAGSPYHGSRTTINSKELGLIVDNEVDHVKVEELADWIIQGKADFRLLDLRNEKEFNDYRIPLSENVKTSSLEKYPLLRNEKIILYSDGGIHSAQAWFLLKAKGYKGVYILLGGLEEWKEKVLFPKIPANASAEQLAAFDKMKEVSKFFGGSPQTGSEETKVAEVKAMPKLEMKSQKLPVKTTKKKKEGC